MNTQKQGLMLMQNRFGPLACVLPTLLILFLHSCLISCSSKPVDNSRQIKSKRAYNSSAYRHRHKSCPDYNRNPARYYPRLSTPPIPRKRRECECKLGMMLVQTAYSQIGRPYVWGGFSPMTGFDCSGLTFWVYRQHGIWIPRPSYEQKYFGRSVSELIPGDLVFFRTLRGKNLHVGIYAGNYKFIHSPKTGGRVKAESMLQAYWHNRYIGARRIL